MIEKLIVVVGLNGLGKFCFNEYLSEIIESSPSITFTGPSIENVNPRTLLNPISPTNVPEPFVVLISNSFPV